MPPTFSSGAPQLQRRRLGVIHIVFFTVAASAPLTVLGGGVTTTYAVTGNVGVPLSFLLLAAALALFAVGYAAMSRHVANAGAFYSYLARGLGQTWAVAGAFVALVSYNAIQIGLYGLFGAATSQFLEVYGVSLPWWVCGLVALALVGALGVLRVDLNARVLAVLLVLEVIAVVLYDIGAFGSPAGGSVSVEALSPSALLVPGVGAVFAFGIAAFIGFESGAIYSEECRNPRVTVARATYVAVAFTGIFYALSAWAMVVNVGAGGIQAAATENGPGLVFVVLAEFWGPVVADIANVLFLTSIFAALLSFHNSVARYLFALGREDVLPAGLARIGTRSGGPVAGSVVQTVIAVVVLLVFIIGGADPVLQIFTWLSGTAAVGVVLLMAATSAAVVGYFRIHRTAATPFQRVIAPAAAAVVLGALVVLLVANFDALLGSDPSSPLRWVLPGLIGLAAVGGAAWAQYLRTSRPAVYDGIGRTALATQDDEAVPDLGLRSR